MLANVVPDVFVLIGIAKRIQTVTDDRLASFTELGVVNPQDVVEDGLYLAVVKVYMGSIKVASLASFRHTDGITTFRRHTFASGCDLEVIDPAADENVLRVQMIYA